MQPICLTIAGSDPTSGAGVQADIRTFDRLGVHPFSAITAITYQTANDFIGYRSLSEDLDQQLNVILNSYPIKYVKIGMIPDNKSLQIIRETIINYDLIAVLDPVTISSAGFRLSSEGLELEIERDLFPYITILTPNLEEAKFYSHLDISDGVIDFELLKQISKNIGQNLYLSKSRSSGEKCVIIKSALHKEETLYDFSCFIKHNNAKYDFEYHLYQKPKLQFKGNVHGSGCVFSSAIASNLVKRYSTRESVERAESFFNEQFQKIIEFPDGGKMINLTMSNEEENVITQIKEIYNYISKEKIFSLLIPEVRMNISAALPYAKSRQEIAGIEGRITVIKWIPLCFRWGKVRSF